MDNSIGNGHNLSGEREREADRQTDTEQREREREMLIKMACWALFKG